MAKQTQQNGGALATQKPGPRAITMIQQLEASGQLAAALPEIGITAARLARIAITALRTTPKLGECHPMSVVACLMEFAQLGLMPNTPLGHGWMVPYKTTAQVVIGYKGYVALAYRAGILLNADVVFEKDLTHGRFEWRKGTDEAIIHVPYQGEDDRGNPVYAYAVAKFPKLGQGATLTKVIDRSEVMRAIASSATGGKTLDGGDKMTTPWYWLKTAVRRLVPMLPLTTEFARAVELESQVDRTGMQRLAFNPDSIASQIDSDTMDAKLRDAKSATEMVVCVGCSTSFPKELARDDDGDVLCPECAANVNSDAPAEA